MTVAGDWGDTRLPLPARNLEESFHRCGFGWRRESGELFDQFPVALLIRSET